MDYSKPSAPDASNLDIQVGPGDTPMTPPSAPQLETKPLLSDEHDKCRYCHRSQADWEFLKPCSCPGVVHRSCLDRWRAVSPNDQSFTSCDECHFVYELAEDPLAPREEGCSPKARFAVGVFRDVALILGISVGLMFLIGWVIVPAADSSYVRNQWFPRSWNQRAIDFVCGLVLFFALIGVLGICTIILRLLASVCRCCCQCCYQSSDEGYSRHYSHSSYPYYGNDIFFWYIFFPFPTRHYHGGHVAHNHCCGALGCGGCDCNCSGGNNNNDGTAVLVLILVLAIIGVIFSIVILTLLGLQYANRYRQIVVMAERARKTVVVDQSGRV